MKDNWIVNQSDQYWSLEPMDLLAQKYSKGYWSMGLQTFTALSDRARIACDCKESPNLQKQILSSFKGISSLSMIA